MSACFTHHPNEFGGLLTLLSPPLLHEQPIEPATLASSPAQVMLRRAATMSGMEQLWAGNASCHLPYRRMDEILFSKRFFFFYFFFGGCIFRIIAGHLHQALPCFLPALSSRRGWIGFTFGDTARDILQGVSVAKRTLLVFGEESRDLAALHIPGFKYSVGLH